MGARPATRGDAVQRLERLLATHADAPPSPAAPLVGVDLHIQPGAAFPTVCVAWWGRASSPQPVPLHGHEACSFCLACLRGGEGP